MTNILVTRSSMPSYEEYCEKLITDNTVAIVPVHVYGNMCDVEEIDRIAKKYGLKVIYENIGDRHHV